MIAALEECAHLGRLRQMPIECGLCSGGFLLAALVAPPWPTAPLILGACITIMRYAGVSWGSILRSLAIPAGFLATGYATLAVSLAWEHGICISSTSSQRLLALYTTLRSLAATSALLLFAFTVPLHRLGSFLRWLRLPPEVVDLFFLMYRTIALLGESYQTLVLAQDNRLGNRSWSARLRGAGALAASLFLLSQQRARAMEMGLAARGYQGTLTVLSTSPRKHPGRILLALSLPLVFTLLGFYLRSHVATDI